jgi:hypothetical protein
MSILITQYPGQLNLASSDMLWEVTSSFTGSAQYQYITVLADGTNTALTTIKQQPNPSGYGVFNLGRIVPQYLGFDTDQFSMGADGIFYKNSQTAKFFKVRFGEQYSSNFTSSVNVYNGIVNNVTGSPAQTGSTAYYYLINGILDPNSGDWNWNTSSFYSPQTTPSSASFIKNVALTDAPRSQSARPTDYLTISSINAALNGSTTVAQDIYAVDLNVYYTGALAYTESFYNESPNNSVYYGGPRTSKAQLWSNVATVQTGSNNSGSQTSGSFLLHLGIGPQNITNYGNFDFSTQNWDYYDITLRPQRSANTINTSASWDKFTITKQDPACGYNGTRFAWINDYGVWDWYNFTLATDKITNMERNAYRANFVPYNTQNTTAAYNIKRRGESYFDINLNEIYTSNSDWLTQEEADWLQGLFYSPNVYIQEGFNMIPIIILDNVFASKINPRTQKNFQYQVTFALANSKRSR